MPLVPILISIGLGKMTFILKDITTKQFTKAVRIIKQKPTGT